jgi:cyanophycinase
MANRHGKLIIIGGAEKKVVGAILKELAKSASKGRNMVLLTVATQEPKETVAEYKHIFKGLGVKNLAALDIRNRQDAHKIKQIKKIKSADIVFITGGDQLRLTSQLGDSPVFQTMINMYKEGLVIAGTSAGAAAMSETMMLSGEGDKTQTVSSTGLAPGLGLVSGVIFDSHFAERGRLGRLLAAVAQNPKNLGIGIDENTAIIFQRNQFEVIGSGGVYVVDGTEISYSSLSEKNPSGVITIHDIRLHILGARDRFDVANKRPVLASKVRREEP